MGNYQNIVYQKEAIQLNVPDTPSSIPPSISVDGDDIPIYRDSQGLYMMLNTYEGKRRANETDWAVLERDKIPAGDIIPEIPGVVATGSITIEGVAEGDGSVGVSFNGVIYSVEPEDGDSAEKTASALAAVINNGATLIAYETGAVISLESNLGEGAAGNIPVIALVGDSKQATIPVGLEGGVDHIPEQPGSSEQPAIFSIWTNNKFRSTYEEV